MICGNETMRSAAAFPPRAVAYVRLPVLRSMVIGSLSNPVQ
jgi:hypothetical protein